MTMNHDDDAFSFHFQMEMKTWFMPCGILPAHYVEVNQEICIIEWITNSCITLGSEVYIAFSSNVMGKHVHTIGFRLQFKESLLLKPAARMKFRWNVFTEINAPSCS
jgi:hypothetical protein